MDDVDWFEDVDERELGEPHVWLLLYASYREMAAAPGATQAVVQSARREAKTCRQHLAHYLSIPYFTVEEKLKQIARRPRNAGGGSRVA